MSASSAFREQDSWKPTVRKVQVCPPTADISRPACSSQMAPGYAVAVMGIDFTLRYFYKVLLDLLPICNQDKGNKIR